MNLGTPRVGARRRDSSITNACRSPRDDDPHSTRPKAVRKYSSNYIIVLAIVAVGAFVWMIFFDKTISMYDNTSSSNSSSRISIRSKSSTKMAAEGFCNDFVVITGCSTNHLLPLQLFLQTLRDRIVNNPAFPYSVRVIFYDLDADPELRTQKKDLLFHGNTTNTSNNDQDYSFLEYREFDFGAYPSHFDMTKGRAGEYAWKPVIIEEVVREQRDQLLGLQDYTKRNSCHGDRSRKRDSFVYWLDAGLCVTTKCSRKNPFSADVTFVRKHGLYTPASPGTLQKWTVPGTAEKLNLTQKLYQSKDIRMGSGGITLIDVHNDFVYENVIVPWKDCALEEDCIAPPGSSRKNHRQDQSALSVLLAKNGIPVQKGTDSVVRGYIERPRRDQRYKLLKDMCAYPNATFA